MDITLLNNEHKVRVKFLDAEVLLAYVPRPKLREIGRVATCGTLVGGKEVEEYDPIEAARLLGRQAVLGWEGFTKDGKDFPYTTENCDFLMVNWSEFSKFVSNTAVDLIVLAEAARAENEKNSSATSEQD